MKETPRYYLQGITEPRNISRAAGVLATASLAAVAACGGGGSADNPTQTDTSPDATPGNTLVVTATPGGTPEVTEVPKVNETETPEPTTAIKKLADAQYVPTDFATVLSSFNAAYDVHPDVEQLHYKGGTAPLSRDNFANNLSTCEIGDPSLGAKFFDIERLNGCRSLTAKCIDIYQQTGYIEFYETAVDAANFYRTQYPNNIAKFDEDLQKVIGESSPSN